MNKARVDSYIPKAADALVECGIAVNGEIKKAFRGQVSSFGAAVASGSLIAAVAAFIEKGNAAVDRGRLIRAIEAILAAEDGEQTSLFDRVLAAAGSSDRFDLFAMKERVLDAALALKLAMNLYRLTDD